MAQRITVEAPIDFHTALASNRNVTDDGESPLSPEETNATPSERPDVTCPRTVGRNGATALLELVERPLGDRLVPQSSCEILCAGHDEDRGPNGTNTARPTGKLNQIVRNKPTEEAAS